MANNIKTIMIKIKDGPLPANGNGRVLLYDGKLDCYYLTTFSDLFKEADRRHEEFKAFADEEIKKLKDEKDEMAKEYLAFKSEMILKYNEFLDSYKQTSEKLILMVEKSKETQE